MLECTSHNLANYPEDAVRRAGDLMSTKLMAPPSSKGDVITQRPRV